ncbi:MAG: enoyl-CoA hydratase/isomerase family protein [bacterium]|nr:enoyl-CoA hydratase [Deltaproteobacteria bacterium]MCP4904214.1 enoyl-CoA hydratase/isomerase family protein [bacterium]
MPASPSSDGDTITTPDVLTERVDHVLIITFNRPERMNSIGGNVISLLSEIFLEAEHDQEIRALVLTGAGRAFCSGLDLKDVSSGSTNFTDTSTGFKINETPPFVMRRMDTPIVCALNGAAAGYGMDLALGCDFILASERARFVPPVRRGVIPESGGTWLLPRLVGWHKACEITLLARPLEAPDIERLGLANRVVSHDALMGEAISWAHELAANAPLAVAAAKRSMRLGLDSTFEANSNAVMAELIQLFRSEDFKESLIAFMEKRPARFEGR